MAIEIIVGRKNKDLSAVRHNRSIVPVGPEAWAQWFTKRMSQKFFDAMNESSGCFLMSSKGDL